MELVYSFGILGFGTAILGMIGVWTRLFYYQVTGEDVDITYHFIWIPIVALIILCFILLNIIN